MATAFRSNLSSISSTLHLTAFNNQLSTCFFKRRRHKQQHQQQQQQQKHKEKSKEQEEETEETEQRNLNHFQNSNINYNNKQKTKNYLKTLQKKVKKLFKRVKQQLQKEEQQIEENSLHEIEIVTKLLSSTLINDTIDYNNREQVNENEFTLSTMTITEDSFLLVRDENPEIDSEIRSILIARANTGATISNIKEDYYKNTGLHFPLYRNIVDFLLSIPSVSAVCSEKGTLIFNIVPTDTTKHLYDLVLQQKPNSNPRQSIESRRLSTYSYYSRNSEKNLNQYVYHNNNNNSNHHQQQQQQFKRQTIQQEQQPQPQQQQQAACKQLQYQNRNNNQYDNNVHYYYNSKSNSNNNSNNNSNANHGIDPNNMEFLVPTTQIQPSAQLRKTKTQHLPQIFNAPNIYGESEKSHSQTDSEGFVENNYFYKDNCNYLFNRLCNQANILPPIIHFDNINHDNNNYVSQKYSQKVQKPKRINSMDPQQQYQLYQRNSNATTSSPKSIPHSDSLFTTDTDYEAHFLDFQLLGDDFFLYMARMELGCKFKKNEKVLQSGLSISGQTIRSAIHHIRNTNNLYKNVIVNIGSVDIMQGRSLIQIEHDFRLLIQILLKRNIVPYLTTLAPLANYGHDKSMRDKLIRFNEFIKRWGKNFQVIDIFKCLVNENNQIHFDCYQKEPRSVTGTTEPYVFWNKVGRQRVLQCIESSLEY